MGRSEPARERETGRKKKGERAKWGAEQGFIPADRGRDMTTVGEEADCKGRN